MSPNLHMCMICLLVRPPIEVNARVITLKFPRLGFRDGQCYLSELAWFTICNSLGIHSYSVLTGQQREICTILRQKEVMVAGHTIRAHIETTSAGKAIITVDPNREVLLRLRALQIDVDALDGLAPRRCAVKESS